MEPTIGLKVVRALERTSHWKCAVDWLTPCGLTSTPPHAESFDILITRALAENEGAFAWRLLGEAIACRRKLDCSTYKAYWDFCRRSSGDHGLIERMLAFIGDNQLFVSQRTIDDLHSLLRDIGGEAHPTEVSDK